MSDRSNTENFASHIVGKFVAVLRDEPRKAAALAALVAFLGMLWIKALSGGAAMPAGALAGSNSSSPLSAQSAPKVSDVSPELTKWRKAGLRPLSRNLFQIQLDRYQPDDAARPPQNGQNGFWEQIANSMDFKADQEKVRKDRVDLLRKEATKLRPKATLNVNGVRTALIDGSLASEGDVINGFRILRIASDLIVVEKDGLRLEILSDPDRSPR